MIVHVHSDDSRGYQYEVGDVVDINDCIAGNAWLRSCVGKVGTISSVYTDRHWRIAKLDVRYSDDWGPAECFAWMVKPRPETRISATIPALPAGVRK